MEFVAGQVRVRVVRPVALTILLGPILAKSVLVTEGTDPLDIALGDNQYTTIHLQGLDAANQAGQFKNPPVWSVDHPEIVLITPQPDGLTCRIEAATPIQAGDAVVTATDADDSTVPPLTFNVEIGGEQITHLGATIDPPTEKTPIPPPPGP